MTWINVDKIVNAFNYNKRRIGHWIQKVFNPNISDGKRKELPLKDVRQGKLEQDDYLKTTRSYLYIFKFILSPTLIKSEAFYTTKNRWAGEGSSV